MGSAEKRYCYRARGLSSQEHLCLLTTLVGVVVDLFCYLTLFQFTTSPEHKSRHNRPAYNSLKKKLRHHNRSTTQVMPQPKLNALILDGIAAASRKQGGGYAGFSINYSLY